MPYTAPSRNDQLRHLIATDLALATDLIIFGPCCARPRNYLEDCVDVIEAGLSDISPDDLDIDPDCDPDTCLDEDYSQLERIMEMTERLRKAQTTCQYSDDIAHWADDHLDRLNQFIDYKLGHGNDCPYLHELF